MPPTRLFVDRGTNTLNTEQIVTEAVPLAKLIALFVGLAFVPFTLVYFLGGRSVFGMLLTVLARFVLAVGSGVVLLYVFARAMELADG